MKTRNAVILTLHLLIGTVHAAAFAISANPNCGSSWSNPIQKINVDDVDDREGLSAARRNMDMTDAEAAIYNRAIGQCICPGSKEGMVRFATCSLLKYNDRVSTNVHLFINKKTKKPYAGINKCYFETLSEPYVRADLRFDKGFAFATKDPQAERNLDFAVVMLSEAVPEIKPIPINEERLKLRPGDVVYMLSASQEGMSKAVTGEPVGQVCKVTGHFRFSTNSQATDFGATCDSLGGGSGAPILFRVNGALVTLGLSTTAAVEKYNGQKATGENGLGTHSFYFTPELVKALSDPKAYAGGTTESSASVTPTAVQVKPSSVDLNL